MRSDRTSQATRVRSLCKKSVIHFAHESLSISDKWSRKCVKFSQFHYSTPHQACWPGCCDLTVAVTHHICPLSVRMFVCLMQVYCILAEIEQCCPLAGLHNFRGLSAEFVEPCVVLDVSVSYHKYFLKLEARGANLSFLIQQHYLYIRWQVVTTDGRLYSGI